MDSLLLEPINHVDYVSKNKVNVENKAFSMQLKDLVPLI